MVSWHVWPTAEIWQPVARHDSVTNADTVTEHPPTAPRAGTVAVLSPPL